MCPSEADYSTAARLLQQLAEVKKLRCPLCNVGATNHCITRQRPDSLVIALDRRLHVETAVTLACQNCEFKVMLGLQQPSKHALEVAQAAIDAWMALRS